MRKFTGTLILDDNNDYILRETFLKGETFI